MLDDGWKSFLEDQMSSEYGRALKAFVKQERSQYIVYPPPEQTLAAFKLTPLSGIKAVIYGQDPYHGPGQAMGLAFSVPAGQQIPPSLENIYKEYCSDLNVPKPPSGDLTKWAREGVLLLNATLTVREHSPMSHAGQGWEKLTAATIAKVSSDLRDIVFILWGKHAASAIPLIDATKHCVLTAPHPSPLSAYRGFFGSRPFSKTNALLEERGISPIDWILN
jgi:uracil-DNA glycosylase